MSQLEFIFVNIEYDQDSLYKKEMLKTAKVIKRRERLMDERIDAKFFSSYQTYAVSWYDLEKK